MQLLSQYLLSIPPVFNKLSIIKKTPGKSKIINKLTTIAPYTVFIKNDTQQKIAV